MKANRKILGLSVGQRILSISKHMIYKNISIIVAIAENFAIGKNNDLLFHLPNDLKRFKSITSGKTIIMGRNTLLSLPKWPLPNRRHIVISDKNNIFIKWQPSLIFSENFMFIRHVVTE